MPGLKERNRALDGQARSRENGIARGTVRINGERVLSFGDFQKRLEGTGERSYGLKPRGELHGRVAYEKFVSSAWTGAPRKWYRCDSASPSAREIVVDPYDFIVMKRQGYRMLFAGELDVGRISRGPSASRR